jgi:hypothetical protein
LHKHIVFFAPGLLQLLQNQFPSEGANQGLLLDDVEHNNQQEKKENFCMIGAVMGKAEYLEQLPGAGRIGCR